MPPRPLGLSDEQLDAIHRLSRASYLELVAQRLQEHGGDLGDGVLHRICVECQRGYWRPPSFSAGKYD